METNSELIGSGVAIHTTGRTRLPRLGGWRPEATIIPLRVPAVSSAMELFNL